MKRWNTKINQHVDTPHVDMFLERLADVCKFHGLVLSHEDGQGAFEVRYYNSQTIDWMMDAHDATTSNPPCPVETPQVGGDHYSKLSIQPWDAMQSWMTLEQFKGYLRGCVIKYLARCDYKGGVEDLKKARHYMDKLIEMDSKT